MNNNYPQSTAQKTLLLSSNDLVALINRVNQLQLEHKKFEHKNQVTQERVNKMIEMKQRAFAQKEKQTQSQNDKLFEQQVKYARVQQLRSENQQDRQAMFQALHDQKTQEYTATKQQSQISQLKYREVRDQEQLRRREQTDKIMKWKSEQKEYLQNYWNQKVSSLKMDQDKNKNQFMIQTSMQNKAIDELEKIELDLIGKLKNSQFISQGLSVQLSQVMGQPNEDQIELMPLVSEIIVPAIPKSEQNWQKKISLSPYLAMPVVSRNTRKFKQPKTNQTSKEVVEDQINKSHGSLLYIRKLAAAQSLPGLIKPDYKQQQVMVDRLYKSKKEYLEKIEQLRQKDFEEQVHPKPVELKKLILKKDKISKVKFQFQKKTFKVNSDSRKNTETAFEEGDEKQQQSHTLGSPEYKKDEENEYQEEDQDFQEENEDEKPNHPQQETPAQIHKEEEQNQEEKYDNDQYEEDEDQKAAPKSANPKTKDDHVGDNHEGDHQKEDNHHEDHHHEDHHEGNHHEGDHHENQEHKVESDLDV